MTPFCILYTLASFLCLDKLSCLFLSITHLLIFYSCYVNVIKHLQEFLSCEIFANFTSAGACPAFSAQPLSVMLISLPSLSFSAHSESWIKRVWTCSQSVISSRTPFKFCLNLQHYHFLFICCNFKFADQFPLSITHFCKISHSFISLSNSPCICPSEDMLCTTWSLTLSLLSTP